MNEQAVLMPVAGERVWRGPDMARQPQQWTIALDSSDIADLEAASDAAERGGLDVLELTRDSFRLPRFEPKLAAVRRDLQQGRGFVLLRGLPVERFRLEQVARIYFGIGAHIGEAVSQNAKGHAVGHVCNLGFDPRLPTARGYQSAHKLNFHTDPTDVVGLLCLRKARSGGESYIVSSATVFNCMLEQRPDLVEVLTRTLYRDRRGEIPAGCKPWYRLPVFNFRDGKLVTNYVRSTIDKAQRFDEVPRLTDEQLEAFALIEHLAASPALTLKMQFEPGDIQLLNNHFVMHSRSAYEDYPEPERRRHLLRLWLACDDAPALPSPYFEFMGKTASGRPNGYLMPGAELSAPLDPRDGGPGDSAQRIAS
jgi:Taurine catabolism dioxygenase TauD, TfdA family